MGLDNIAIMRGMGGNNWVIVIDGACTNSPSIVHQGGRPIDNVFANLVEKKMVEEYHYLGMVKQQGKFQVTYFYKPTTLINQNPPELSFVMG